MAPHLEPYTYLAIAYWLLMVLIAAWVLAKVTNYCIDDGPGTFLRAVRMVVGVAALVFVTYDLSGYVFALLMQDPGVGIQLPAHYTYWDWLREPVGLKWRVLGFVPFVRYIPVAIALLVGVISQILIWKITLPYAVLVFFGQLFFDLLAMVALSFVFRFGIELYAKDVAQPAQHRSFQRGETERTKTKSEPAGLAELESRVEDLAPEAGPFWRRLSHDWEAANSHLAPLYRRLQPVTDHLPPPAQDFLNGGGWIAVFVGIGAVCLAWPRFHRRRQQIHQHKRHRLARAPDAAGRL
jgi:hypothetical protein